jgi:uncharacterized protein
MRRPRMKTETSEADHESVRRASASPTTRATAGNVGDHHGIRGGRHGVLANFGLLVAGCAFLVAGCSLPQAQSDPTRFYVLSTGAAVPPAATETPAIRLRPVELASYLRGRPIVVRKGNNEIQFREYARWGEPLEQGIARVLREELLARGANITDRAAERGYELSLRVLACEGGADGTVLFHAVWQLTGGDDAATKQGDFRATGLTWDRKSEATLAAGLSDAVRALGAEIAPAVAKK